MVLGTDIEMFVIDKQTKKAVNACGIVQGTKYSPYQWKEGGFLTSLDCIMMEYNTPATSSKDVFIKQIYDSQQYLKSLLSDNLELSAFPYYDVDPDQLYTVESITFGCEPDINAYTGKFNRVTVNPETFPGRSAGMHLHIDVEHSKQRDLVKLLDFTLAIPSLLLEPDNNRKALYGKAGSYRDNIKWVEYRTLSSWFQQLQYLDFIWNNSQMALHFLEDNFKDYRNYDIKNIIKNNDKAGAELIVKKYNLL
jgi:hypothetical protein